MPLRAHYKRAAPRPANAIFFSQARQVMLAVLGRALVYWFGFPVASSEGVGLVACN